MNKKEELELVIRALKSLRTLKRRKFGICYYFKEYNDEYLSYHLIKPYFKSWPKFSGNLDYPVPSPVENGKHIVSTLAYFAYDLGDDMWDKYTQYGSDRHELLEHCITEATKKLRTYTDE